MVMAGVSAGATALARVYGFDSPTAFMAAHIQTLRVAENPLAQRCGEVLSATIDGFGVGSESSLMLLKVGRLMLGVVETGLPMAGNTNPVTLTCAAVGAVYYGWSALTEQEKAAILSSVAAAFSVGLEFVRAIVEFAVRMLAQVPGLLSGAAACVRDTAAAAGQTLGAVSATVGVGISGAFSVTSRWAGDVVAGLPWRALPFANRSTPSHPDAGDDAANPPR